MREPLLLEIHQFYSAEKYPKKNRKMHKTLKPQLETSRNFLIQAKNMKTKGLPFDQPKKFRKSDSAEKTVGFFDNN